MSGGSNVSTYQYGNQSGADTAASKAIANIPTQWASSGYTPQSTVQAGNNVINSVSGIPQYASMALTSGFDPQGAIYNQQFQQNQDQTRASEAARGIAMTPYGAGLENLSNINFNNQWQQNALTRQQTGAQTANSLLGQYAGSTLGGTATAVTGAQAAVAPYQQQVSDYLNYLSGGTAADNAAVNAANSNNSANNGLFSGVGSILGGVASLIP